MDDYQKIVIFLFPFLYVQDFLDKLHEILISNQILCL